MYFFILIAPCTHLNSYDTVNGSNSDNRDRTISIKQFKLLCQVITYSVFKQMNYINIIAHQVLHRWTIVPVICCGRSLVLCLHWMCVWISVWSRGWDLQSIMLNAMRKCNAKCRKQCRPSIDEQLLKKILCFT